MKNYILISLLFILTVFSCRKDFEENQITENPHVPVFIDNYHPAVENVTSSVFGVVVDEDGQAVEGAEISLGSLTQMTNVFGTFSFDNIEMNKKGTFVQVEKAGYFLSGRRFYPTEGNKNKIKIELLQKNFSESFESGVGGTVAISDNGGTIVFQPNSIRTEAGDSYNGTVHVATKYLDPTALVTFDQMPGALQGVNSSNEEGGLSTYGMIGVELQGDAGEQLNIADNQTAKITMNLPASLQGAAPAEIPLWSFNYTYGIWVEDGKALLQDGKYVGEVSHFSFWNCDLFSEVVGFGVAVVDNNQEPIEGAGVKISLANGLSSGFGYTGTNGYVGGILPANEELLLEVISPCGDILYTQTIGPFMAGISIGTIEIEVANVIEITGTILNCDGGEVNNGIVIIKQGGVFNSYIVDTNPFSIRIVACSNISNVEVIAGNLDTYEQGDIYTFPFSNNINAGELESCGQPLLGYMKVTIEGATRFFKISSAREPDTINPLLLFITMNEWDQPDIPANESVWGHVTLYSSGLMSMFGTAGDYGISNPLRGNSIDTIYDTQNEWSLKSAQLENFTVDVFGPYVGTELSAHFSGFLENTYGGQSSQVWMEGEFRVIRTQ